MAVRVLGTIGLDIVAKGLFNLKYLSGYKSFFSSSFFFLFLEYDLDHSFIGEVTTFLKYTSTLILLYLPALTMTLLTASENPKSQWLSRIGFILHI